MKTAMDKFCLETFVLGEIETNSYLLYEENSRKGFLIDVPSDTLKLKQFIAKQKIDLEFIVLTHGHYDHIGGVADFSCKFYIHKTDQNYLVDTTINGSAFFGSPVTVPLNPILLKEGDKIDFSGLSFLVINTPGHTPGSICLYGNNWLFSGDTLFYNCVGRTDLPLGSQNSLIKSIKEKLFVLPDSTKVYPGHGNPTTIGREKKRNPFLKD